MLWETLQTTLTSNLTSISFLATSPDIKKTFHLDRWNLQRFTRTREYIWKSCRLEYFTFYQVCVLQGKLLRFWTASVECNSPPREFIPLQDKLLNILVYSDQTDIDILFMLENILLCVELFMRNSTISVLYTNIWSGRMYFPDK